MPRLESRSRLSPCPSAPPQPRQPPTARLRGYDPAAPHNAGPAAHVIPAPWIQIALDPGRISIHKENRFMTVSTSALGSMSAANAAAVNSALSIGLIRLSIVLVLSPGATAV